MVTESTTNASATPSGDDDGSLVVALAVQLFLRADADAVACVPEDVSTRVYRILTGDATYYLRVLPEEEDSFAPEVLAHALLRESGVRVPEVVSWEHRNPRLGCSVKVTTEIAGEPLGRVASDLTISQLRAVLVEAGRELAILNRVPVAGFGWVCRNAATVARLTAEQPTFRAFALEYFDADLALLADSWGHLLRREELAAIRRVVAERGAWRGAWLDVPHGFLAHGDFDVSHIFVAQGHYSGIIDLGEMRGADPLYDLAHFALHEGERLPAGLLAPLLEGYAAERALPADYPERPALLQLLIGTHALARRLARRGDDETARHLVHGLRRALSSLQA